MKFNITRRWDRPQSFRVESVVGQFTLQDVKLEKVFRGNIDVEDEEWQVGVIVGRSGTGKTTIAKHLFPDAYIRGFTYKEPSILDDFPEQLPTTDITRALSSVGFSSPPEWLKSYEQLSQGEKMRVDIARALLLNEPIIVFDEFTSVVDREVAKVSSLAIQKAVRRTSKQFIAVTCHYDVIDYLEPDWVLCTDDMSFTKKKLGTPLSSSRSGAAAYISGTPLRSIII
jgi:ABC-type ATPase with predicted acetyltransferase domain